LEFFHSIDELLPYCQSTGIINQKYLYVLLASPVLVPRARDEEAAAAAAAAAAPSSTSGE